MPAQPSNGSGTIELPTVTATITSLSTTTTDTFTAAAVVSTIVAVGSMLYVCSASYQFDDESFSNRCMCCPSYHRAYIPL